MSKLIINSFATHAKSKYWSDKNKIKPNEVFMFSLEKFFFNCDKCEHDFEKSLVSVSRKNTWCPYCTNIKLCDNDNCNDCFNKSFESNVKKQYWSVKNIEKPREVFNGSTKKFIFDCDKCDHEFIVSLDHIEHQNSWCSYCSNHKLCDDDNCTDCFNKSFESSIKKQYWSEKNIDKPRQIFKSSAKNFIFNCDKCNHEFVTSPSQITNKKSWCPYCPNNKLCKDNNCNDCLNKSFESHKKSEYWSDKNIEKPRQVFKNSAKKYFFNCDICEHEINISLNHISTHDAWCGYCSNKILCNSENCNDCFKKSFASHEKSIFWSNKNILAPRNVFKGSGEKYFFYCDKCKREFQTHVKSVTNGSWCPNCVYKTQSKLETFLSQKYENLICGAKFEWCKNERLLPFDFYIKSKNVIIELDGAQHFIQVSNWKSSEETRITDKYKMMCANKNKLSVIRILQEDVLNNKYDCLKELNENIDKISSSNKVYNIYMCKNNEYDIYK